LLIMAQISLSENRWRMLRLALRKKRFRFEDVRTWRRRDQDDVDWLVENEFFADIGNGYYELTDKGRESSDLGYYEWEPPKRQTAGATATRRRVKK
jgi:hypothetical protein